MLWEGRFLLIIAMMLHTEGDKDSSKHKEDVGLNKPDKQLERHKWQYGHGCEVAR